MAPASNIQGAARDCEELRGAPVLIFILGLTDYENFLYDFLSMREEEIERLFAMQAFENVWNLKIEFYFLRAV